MVWIHRIWWISPILVVFYVPDRDIDGCPRGVVKGNVGVVAFVVGLEVAPGRIRVWLLRILLLWFTYRHHQPGLPRVSRCGGFGILQHQEQEPCPGDNRGQD